MSSSQPYEPICSSNSCGEDLKVLLNFSEGTLERNAKQNVFIDTYIKIK